MHVSNNNSLTASKDAASLSKISKNAPEERVVEELSTSSSSADEFQGSCLSNNEVAMSGSVPGLNHLHS